MDESDAWQTVSRRRLLNDAAVVAGAGLAAALATPATHAVETASSLPRRGEPPRLPLNYLTRNRFDDDFYRQIQGISPQITILPSERFKEELPNADAIIGKLTPEEFATAKRLRWVQVTSGGVDTLMFPEFVNSDVILTNTSGCYGSPIAETAIAFLLALVRGVGFASYNRKWEGFNVRQIELRGLTMGIIGLGGIGREVARRAKALDMYVMAVDAEPMFRERYAMVDELHLVDTHYDYMLSRCDVLVCCAPLTPRTRGMIGAREIGLMKDGSYLINVTRGRIVDTQAVLSAIRSKKLAGAGLDVTDPEPLPADHPLWQEPNVIITPHKAGGSQHSGKRERELFIENMRRYVAGLPMLNVIDKQKGY
ncbi:D-2-hydroxyacid dehydrogenase [Fontivita pretiosa]|uniref:D-2-hydroxyacid dehydrogenase n=1 Tax=Fontivita pretiosa TaxID=2989684 RepID=UPI003D176716